MKNDRKETDWKAALKGMSLYSLDYARRAEIAEDILKQNLAKVRAKPDEVKTTLTREIGMRDGVKAYSVPEIQWVYGVDRATAYRWKKGDVHPCAKPTLRANATICWVDSRDTVERKRAAGMGPLPWNPKRDAIRMARNAVRCALNKLKKLQEDPDYEGYPLDKSCLDMVDEMKDAANDLDLYVLDESDYDYDDEEDGGEKDEQQRNGAPEDRE